MITLQRDLKRFDAKFHSPESTVVESGTSRLDENINANEKQKESSIASIDSRSESSTGLEPVRFVGNFQDITSIIHKHFNNNLANN